MDTSELQTFTMAINFELRSVSTRKNAASNLYCVYRENGLFVKFTIFLALRYRKFRIFAIPKKNEEISSYICPDGRLAVLNGRRAQL